MGAPLVLTDAETQEILAQRAAAAAAAGAPTDSSAVPAPAVPAVAPAPPSWQQLLAAIATPLLQGAAGPYVQAAGAGVQAAVGVGKLFWRLFNPHTGASSTHPTFQAAHAAALNELQTTHAGICNDPTNPTTVEITPVFHVGIPDVIAANAAAIPVTPTS